MNRCTLKLGKWFVCALIVGSLFVPTGVVVGEEKMAKTTGEAPSDEEMMAMMMKLATPGPEHAELKKMEGNWNTVTKAWMGPGDPKVTKGKCKNSLVLGGRFLMSDYEGSFMEQPFQGMGLLGFDNGKKEYVNVWADVHTTNLTLSRGKADGSGKNITMMAYYDNPAGGEKIPMKMVTRIIDDNKHVFEMFEKKEGKEVKSLEITYTRQ